MPLPQNDPIKYKDPYPVEVACDIINQDRGQHFDPELVDLFIANLDEFTAIKDSFSEGEPEQSGRYQLSERDQK